MRRQTDYALAAMATTSTSVDAHAIRASFLDFFGAQDHEVVRSSPLVPQNDPSLLFVNAGMVQFKDVFTGREQRSYTRATSVQRCLRAGGKHNDLDNVGFTPRHHTLFEMLGNFSFGDYFKQDAIRYAWEFLTKVLAIPEERLCVSVFNGEGEQAPFDQEAYELWLPLVPKERIYAFDAKENFWQMGDTGPCGPCSEIHIAVDGAAPPDAGTPGKGPAFEDSKYLELWNLVFMQYEKVAGGSLKDLPKPSIDTGAGLERLAATVAGARSNYETELLAPLVRLGKSLAGVSGPQGDQEAAFQVIADHARATAFLIADGVFPDRDGRAYVLRRIMRRAIRYGTRVGLDDTFFPRVCTEVADLFSDAYPELKAARATIEEVVGAEEASFRRTLSRGIKRLEGTLEDLEPATKAFPVPVAAELYDTYGFPIDLTGVIAKEHGLSLDEAAVGAQVKERQAGGEQRLGGGDETISDVYFALEQRLAQSFVGYETLACDATVTALLVGGAEVTSATSGDEVEVFLDRTPLYAESGGQIGDEGIIAWEGGGRLAISDCLKPATMLHVHRGVVEAGGLEVGATVSVRVQGARRDAIRRNHSATHLLHHALREVLGPHVIQKGSLVTQDRLRFDFSHNRPVTADERRSVEALVNAEIWANAPSTTEEMGLDAAKDAGAIGLFGEKYGEEVRVVSIGRSSVELCGGTHVHAAGEIGMLCVVSETGIAQGVRRIEAVTGAGALQHVQSMTGHLEEAGAMVHAPGGAEVVDRIEKMLQDLKGKDQEITALQRKLATGAGGEEAVVEVEGVKILARAVPGADAKSLRDAADTLRDRLKTGVVVLAGERDEKAMLLVAVTPDLKGRLHAGKLVGALAAHVDGRGGGRPDLAQAGGPNVAGIPAALEAAPQAVRDQLAH